MFNNQFNLVMAQRFAERLQKKTTAIPDQIDKAMQLIVQRNPNSSEREGLQDYVGTHGLANLCRVLFNLSEFVYLD